MGVANRFGLMFFVLCLVSIAFFYLKEEMNQQIKITVSKNASSLSSLVSPYIHKHMPINRSHIKSFSGKTHHILWWNKPYWIRGWDRSCTMSQCKYGNCLATEDKKYMDNSSAVIITIVGTEARKLPVPQSRRNPDQAWAFFTLESPLKIWNRVFETDEWRNVFNWSMTYRRDSDIFIPYGLLGHRETSLNKSYSEIFRRKSRDVAWIVSHCPTSGKREKYVEELQKYIQVDIYGRCGTKVTDDILYKLLPRYKFYLGFENALCKDYMTEKFFRYFEYDWIVIVRGLTDYGKHLPNNTFINSADFSSIQSLGQYLTRLAKDEEQYIQYLKEKDKYEVLSFGKAFCNSLCSICEKVNHVEKYRRTYGNIFDWAGSCDMPTDVRLTS